MGGGGEQKDKKKIKKKPSRISNLIDVITVNKFKRIVTLLMTQSKRKVQVRYKEIESTLFIRGSRVVEVF